MCKPCRSPPKFLCSQKTFRIVQKVTNALGPGTDADVYKGVDVFQKLTVGKLNFLLNVTKPNHPFCAKLESVQGEMKEICNFGMAVRCK